MKITYFFFFLLFLYNVHGFGVSPGVFQVVINNDEELEKEFFIYNNEDELKRYNISGNGFFNFTDFITEVNGNSEKEVKILINVPYETLEGNYLGRIYVNEINKEEGGVNLDTLLGIKFEFFVTSNYTEELEENSFRERLEFKEINKEELEFEIEEEFEFEIVLFYSLIILVILLGFYIIYKNRQIV
ncbi:MAG: hypothetical protein AABW58_03280 [Nanoarchaeota archaeon]